MPFPLLSLWLSSVFVWMLWAAKENKTKSGLNNKDTYYL
jgi:hypothetical protein